MSISGSCVCVWGGGRGGAWEGSGGHLVTGLAARLQPLGVVPSTVDLSVLVEVDEVHQQLGAGGALETLGVPTAAVPRPTGEHRYVPATDLSAALEKKTCF